MNEAYDPVWDDVISERTGTPMYYDKRAKPISMRQWAELTSYQLSYKTIRWHFVRG